MSALLAVRDLAKSYGGVRAVGGVSFSVSRGEKVALIGPNGAGKSTCFNMLSGQIAPDAGTIRIEDRDTAGWRPRDVWRLGVGRTFQMTATFASMTVIENVQVVLLSHARRLGRAWGVAPRQQRARAAELLALVGMAAQAQQSCAELAYGDLKRLELAMALVNEPRLLLMDEPTVGMSPRDRVELMKLTADIVRDRHLGVLFTEHDMDVVFRHADRILVLSRGRLIAEGTPEAVRRDPKVQAVYLGDGLTYRDRDGGPS